MASFSSDLLKGAALSAPLETDLLWGTKAISDEIARSPRQTHYLLENSRLPARKIGGRWCASRAALRAFFANALSDASL
jgi:hypothetical protein